MKLKIGDIIIVDDGFDCMEEGEEKEIFDDDGNLYIICNQGKHYLKNEFTGLTLKERK